MPLLSLLAEPKSVFPASSWDVGILSNSLSPPSPPNTLIHQARYPMDRMGFYLVSKMNEKEKKTSPAEGLPSSAVEAQSWQLDAQSTGSSSEPCVYPGHSEEPHF